MFYDWNWNKERNKKRYCEGGNEPTFKGLNLRHSDPGKLFALLSELDDETCPPIERKINGYLMDVTGAALTFFLHVPLLDEDLEINVMGDTVLQETFFLPADSDFARRIVKANSPLLADDAAGIDAELVTLLSKNLKRSANEHFRNVLLLPVNMEGCRTPFFCGIVNSSTRLGGMEKNRTLVLECLSYCKAVVRSTFICDTEKMHIAKSRSVLKTAALAFTNVNSEIGLATILRKETTLSMDASRAKIYFFKKLKDEGYTRLIEFDEPHEKAELVSLEKTMQAFISIPEIVINKNPGESFVFPDIENCLSNYEIRTFMSFPTFCNGVANGHVEVFNKQKAKRFSKTDQKMAECLGCFYGLAIEALWKFKNLRERILKNDMTDSILMRRANIHCLGVKDIIACPDFHAYNHLLEFGFKPYDVQDEHTICVILGILEELDFIRHFQLTEVGIVRFLLSVKKAHGNLPYHNWYHGFGTAHFVFMLFYSLSILKNGVFSQIEGFALLIAALAHDVDFRGCTTPFQVFAGDTLASLYSSAGGLQQRLGLASVLQMIVHPYCNILSNMDTSDFKTFISLLQLLFADLNLDFYVDRMDDVYAMTFEKYDRQKTTNVRNLLSLCLVCAEFSDYSRPWNYFMSIHDRQMLEFYRSEERRATDGPFDLDDAILKPKVQIDLQINFMRCFVLPTFENLHIMFPTFYACYKTAETNMRRLKELRELVQKFPGSSISDLISFQ
ncbi:phosphodiesterase [Nesidiocoris tenuis]|uniref:Phosphodiesterase n=1 Tax=Nesidiocoris tenuis TaxID=355587 RepID=A0ABN7A6G2_9HEMI|nr:phosphodiesterase [Nesidiocoris tenuis]